MKKSTGIELGGTHTTLTQETTKVVLPVLERFAKDYNLLLSVAPGVVKNDSGKALSIKFLVQNRDSLIMVITSKNGICNLRVSGFHPLEVSDFAEELGFRIKKHLKLKTPFSINIREQAG
ncbi:MAG: hypothetical protein ACRCXZ_06930 [Patescibacteria group bacterium]